MAVDFKDYARRMDKALDHLNEEFCAVRAGRANAKVLDRITVEYYGSETSLNGVATISTPDARTLVIQPWDTKLPKSPRMTRRRQRRICWICWIRTSRRWMLPWLPRKRN